MALGVSAYPSCCVSYIVRDFPGAHGHQDSDENTEIQLREIMKRHKTAQLLVATLNGNQITRMRPILERCGWREVGNSQEGYAERMAEVGKKRAFAPNPIYCFISDYLSRNRPLTPEEQRAQDLAEAERRERERIAAEEARKAQLERYQTYYKEGLRRALAPNYLNSYFGGHSLRELYYEMENMARRPGSILQKPERGWPKKIEDRIEMMKPEWQRYQREYYRTHFNVEVD